MKPNTSRDLVRLGICLTVIVTFARFAPAQQGANDLFDALLNELEAVHSGEFEATCRIKRSVDGRLRTETEFIRCWFAPGRLRWEARSDEGFVVGLSNAGKSFVAVNDSDAILVDPETFDQYLGRFDYRCFGFDLPIGLDTSRDANQLIAKYKKHGYELLEGDTHEATLAVEAPHGVFSILVDTKKHLALGMDYRGTHSRTRHSSTVEWIQKSGEFVPHRVHLDTDTGHLSGTIAFEWLSVNETFPSEVFALSSTFSKSNWVIEETARGDRVVQVEGADESFFVGTKRQSQGVWVSLFVACLAFILLLTVGRYRKLFG